MNSERLRRWFVRVGVALLFVVAAGSTGLYVNELGTSSNLQKSGGDLASILSRRSPSTEYTAAEFGHNDCRTNYEDAFLSAVGHAITIPRDDPSQLTAAAEIARLTDILGHIEVHCPTPHPPQFDEAGNLIAPPILPSTTTSTIPPPLTVPASSG